MISFDEMGLERSILQAIDGLGFVQPTPIQEKVIPKILQDDDDLIAWLRQVLGKQRLLDCR